MAVAGLTWEIHGAREVQRRLDELGERLAKRGARAAVRAGNAELKRAILEAARGKFKRRSGTLFRNIRTMVRLSRSGVVRAYVFLDSDAFYGRFFELGGTWIGRGKGRRALHRRGQLTGGQKFRRPWMKPAFDAAADRAFQAVVNVLREHFDTAGA